MDMDYPFCGESVGCSPVKKRCFWASLVYGVLSLVMGIVFLRFSRQSNYGHELFSKPSVILLVLGAVLLCPAIFIGYNAFKRYTVHQRSMEYQANGTLRGNLPSVVHPMTSAAPIAANQYTRGSYISLVQHTSTTPVARTRTPTPARMLGPQPTVPEYPPEEGHNSTYDDPPPPYWSVCPSVPPSPLPGRLSNDSSNHNPIQNNDDNRPPPSYTQSYPASDDDTPFTHHQQQYLSPGYSSLQPSGEMAERVSLEISSPGRVSPGRLSPRSSSPRRDPPGRASPRTASPERVSPGRSSPMYIFI